MEQAWRTLTARAAVATIPCWMPLFPAEHLAVHPELPIYFARACFMAGLPDEAARWFEHAGPHPGQPAARLPGLAGMRGLYLSSRATLAVYRGDLRAGLVYARAAARVQTTIGLCRNMQGDVAGAQRAFEISILRLIAGGATNRDVADTLVITVGTVKSHLNRILGKLGARNRTEAVAKARALGLVP